ncbi:MAG TPA: hypothetical protein VGB41_05085 [Acidimicrobiia bacterium]
MPLLLAGTLWFGGLGLAAGDAPGPSPEVAPASPVAPAQVPVLPGAAILGGAALAALALSRREPGAALGLKPPEDAVVVFVPGHGQGEASEVFDDLIDLMGLDSDAARYFDYRLVTGEENPVDASEHASIDDATRALNAYIGAVALEGRPVWIVGFSKGGATVANLVAAWDDGAYGPADAVEGAFLLDPPISAGAHGWLQSLGQGYGPIPDDGGYDPVQCWLVLWGCHDEREQLGEAAGVEVLVVRNPDAGVTSFGDHPDGLRVVDAPDGGRGFWDQVWHDPLGLPARVATAHEAVLGDPAVARCLVAEMSHTGGCDLKPAGPLTGPKAFRKPRPRRGPLRALLGPRAE